MKKMLFLLLCIVLFSCISYDVFEVIQVKKSSNTDYKYYVTLSVENNFGSYDKFDFYTNDEYRVGDKLKLTMIED